MRVYDEKKVNLNITYMDLIQKLKKSGLTGRGGAGFPTWQKWSAVAKAMADKKNGEKKSYVVCNASEGEPGIKKDAYIIENYPEKLIKGIKIAIEYFGAEKAYIYLNPDFYKKYEQLLKKIIKDSPIELFKKPVAAGYIGGEETSALNCLEGKRVEPRFKPPFPTTDGLWNYPTLINNVETFYAVCQIAENKFENKRFYTLNGDCLWTGVYELPENWPIEKILKETKNYPDFDFFVQIGGDASGEVLNHKMLAGMVNGAGSITIYSVIKYNPIDIIKNWVSFFLQESCGQCTPCREGVYRINELLKNKIIDWGVISELLDNLSDTSFCALGASLPVPINSFIKNVVPFYPRYGSLIKK
jgi:NADH:ubiquinone oxidoreductase subunit F (NADH-binding)